MTLSSSAVFGLSFTVLAVFLWGCEKREDPGVETDLSAQGDEAALCSIQDAIEYSEHISAVLEKNCASCHSSARSGVDRNSAPTGVDFDSRDGAVQSAEAANRRIQSGQMPPTAPLNACEKRAFQGWVESGTPK